jgi:signal transduction histidine kinase
MKWSVEKKTLIGLGFASMILISINAFAYWRVNQNKSTFAQAAHIRKVLEQLKTVSSDIKDAETGQRGYLLTGNGNYLEPYLAAVAKIRSEIQELKTLTANNPNQQRQLDALNALVTEKVAELDQTIDLRRDKGFEAAQQVVLTDHGKQVMDKIRTIIQELEQEEAKEREQLLQKVQTNDQKDTFISTTGIVLSFVLLYFVYYTLKRELMARRQAEWALQKLNAEIYEALESEKKLNELKSRIVTVISHEYRTPLTTILSSAELLEYYNHKWSQEKQISHLHRIQSAANHLTELVKDMLDISQAESGRLEFNPSSLDLESFCRQLVEELKTSDAGEHSISFVFVGNCSSCVVDEKLLRQVLTNLLLNAMKYSDKDSTIRFELQCQEDAIAIQIQDQGIGIPPEDQSRLFQPFERGTNVGTISGTGLGLAIVKKLLDLQGGQITVESRVGVGTTFIVTLPQNTQVPVLHPI